MVGINTKISCHALKIDPKIKPKMQRRRPMIAKKYKTLKSEVHKSIENSFIRKAQYLAWVYNSILVPKSNGK